MMEESVIKIADTVIKNRRRRLKNQEDIFHFIKKIILLIICIYILFQGIFGIIPMKDMTMSPRISPGDLVLFYRLNHNYGNQDVVVIEIDGEMHLGRIVAKPGDKVEITDKGEIIINDSLVVENDIFYQTKPYDSKVKYPVNLIDDEFFVLGDFREGAKDSRVYGAVKAKDLKGQVMTVLRKSSL
ncbi:signal peptidase I [Eubacteriales bacterium KG125]